MNTIRTFIAIDTPEEYKPIISGIQRQLKATGADVRWEQQKKFHITLKFLGDVKEKVLPGIISQLESVLTEYRSFELTYRGLGCFPNHRFPKILWLGAENTDGTLLNIRTTIEDEVLSFGFQREKAAFTPHITIGRVKGEHGISDLISTLERLTLEPRTFRISNIVIMKSILKPPTSEYAVLKTIQLLN